MPDPWLQTSFARPAVASEATCIAGMHRAGMLDWPGRVTATVFLAGCPLRCPYCHNPELLQPGRNREGTAGLIEHMRERRAWLDGVVVTGGEPTAHPGLTDLLQLIASEGLPVKLDTNGTAPEVLRAVLADGLVSYVALDVKATPDRYARAAGKDVWPDVQASIQVILDSGIDHEFRTTCYPLAVGPDDPVTIARSLDGGQRYVLQQFRPQMTLDPAAISVRPHDGQTLCRAADRCSAFLPTSVRGV